MKNLVIIFLCISFFSCKTNKETLLPKETLSPFVTAYKSDWTGNVYPAYIFLKKQPQFFEVYAPGIYKGVTGEWNISNDTLYTFPKYLYYSKNDKLKFREISISPEDSTIMTIPQQYLIRKDSLIDITDYSIVIPPYIYEDTGYKEVFKLIK